IIALVGPVRDHLLEDVHQLVRLEALDKIAPGGGVALVGGSEEHVNFAIEVGRAEDLVEIDSAVEEAPGNVAHEGAEETIHRQGVEPLRRVDMGEILVTLEIE